jgi:hypothetical protein
MAATVGGGRRRCANDTVLVSAVCDDGLSDGTPRWSDGRERGGRHGAQPRDPVANPQPRDELIPFPVRRGRLVASGPSPVSWGTPEARGPRYGSVLDVFESWIGSSRSGQSSMRACGWRSPTPCVGAVRRGRSCASTESTPPPIDERRVDVFDVDEAVVEYPGLLRQNQNPSCPVGEALEHRPSFVGDQKPLISLSVPITIRGFDEGLSQSSTETRSGSGRLTQPAVGPPVSTWRKIPEPAPGTTGSVL